MKNLKTKIIILASLVSTLGFFGVSQAASVYLYASPANLTKNVQASFNVSANIMTAGSEVYAVEGTIVFNNLTCKNITLADGMVAQTAPTCSNPYFLIGIPKGTNVDTALFKMLVSGSDTGTATIQFTDVNIIGAGVSISNSSAGGEYQIVAVPVVNEPQNKNTQSALITAPTSTIAISTSSENIASSSAVAQIVNTNTDNKGNGFVASVLSGLSNVPKMLMTLTQLSIIVLLLLIGLIFYTIPENNISKS